MTSPADEMAAPMIIHRFTFLVPVQLPGRAPGLVFEPAAANNIGYTARRLPDGWLFTGPPGTTSGLSASGRDELAAIGEDVGKAALSVLVPHGQVIVQYAGDRFDGGDLPTRAPSAELEAARDLARSESARKAAEAPPPAEPPPAPTPAAPPPQASRRRTPPGVAAAPPPPPSVGWVADE